MLPAPSLSARAFARVGLLGNPSDLYGGQGLGFALRELGAQVTLEAARETAPLAALFAAAWQLFAGEHLAARGIDPRSRPFSLRSSSEIPFQAGLAGSSALIIAALRAWGAWFDAPLSRGRTAELAWRTENEVLGIRAGPLDRLVQAHEGLLAMDFARAFAPDALQRLDPALLPPMLIAWHGQPGANSGDVHAALFARFQAGDRRVHAWAGQLAANALAGRAALEGGDRAAFLDCVNRNFELRSELFEIAPADRALVQLGRDMDAAAKLPGSGGAVLFACRDPAQRERLEAVCRARGLHAIVPTVAPPTPRLRAVFLAAGFATRLYPLTLHRAKPLLEVGGEPLLTRIVRQVEAMGCVADGVLVSNARFHADFLAWQRKLKPAIPLQVLNDGAPSNESRLGAVRDLDLALRAALPDAAAPDGYLVLACDNLFEFELARLAERFAASGRSQLIVREVPQPLPAGKYSEVVLDPSGSRVASFREKPADPRSNLSAIAVYLLPPDLPGRVREYLASGGNPDAPGHLIAWLAERIPLEATRLSGRWIDIGSAQDLARAAEL